MTRLMLPVLMVIWLSSIPAGGFSDVSTGDISGGFAVNESADEMTPGKRMDRVLVLFNSGMYPEALSACEDIIKDTTEIEFADDALFYAGRSLRLLNRYSEAESYFNRLVKTWKNSPFAAPARAEIYLLDSQVSSSESAVISLAPETEVATQLEAGDRQMTLGDIDGAILAYQKARSLDPRHAVVYYKLGNAYLAAHEAGKSGTGTDYSDLAEKNYRISIFHGDFSPARLNLGVLLARKGDHTGARSQWLEIMKKGNQVRGFDEARENYRLSLRRDMDSRTVPYIFLFGYNHQ